MAAEPLDDMIARLRELHAVCPRSLWPAGDKREFYELAYDSFPRLLDELERLRLAEDVLVARERITRHAGDIQRYPWSAEAWAAKRDRLQQQCDTALAAWRAARSDAGQEDAE